VQPPGRTGVYKIRLCPRDWNSRSKLIPQSTSAVNAMHPSGNGQSPLLGTYGSTEVGPKAACCSC